MYGSLQKVDIISTFEQVLLCQLVAVNLGDFGGVEAMGAPVTVVVGYENAVLGFADGGIAIAVCRTVLDIVGLGGEAAEAAVGGGGGRVAKACAVILGERQHQGGALGAAPKLGGVREGGVA